MDNKLSLMEVSVDSVKAPYLVNFDGDVCDFYFRSPGGQLGVFPKAYANAERIKALWNATTDVPTECFVNGWLFRFVIWIYRKTKCRPFFLT